MNNSAAPNIIQVKVDDVSQLFNTLDPTPFRERDLDKDAEDFIVGWMRELSQRKPVEIIIYVRDTAAQKLNPQQVREALNGYFAYRANAFTKELKELFRVGRRSAIIGLTVLAICMLLSSAVAALFGKSDFSRYVSEGLNILGWVANWNPIEIFLYDWWPVVQRRNLYRRLSKVNVTVRNLSTLN
jgi:hypothetical protein